MIGQTVSHYKILEKLGAGGMGVVYKAQDLKLKRTVAIKLLAPELAGEPEAIARFIHEAQAASALDHPNICTIHEIDRNRQGQWFIVMTCYEGETLKEKVRRGALKLGEAIDIALQVAHGLAKAHERGIIHRDIKPANLLITPEGTVKILDFGVAKLAGQTRFTKSGVAPGTVAYMSPEQMGGEEVDPSTDIWSLGVVLYEMVTGQLPFKGGSEQADTYFILKSSFPESLQKIMDKALKKDKHVRYQSSADLLADLKIEKRGIESGERIPPKPNPIKKLLPFLIPAAAGLFVLLWYVIKPPEAEPLSLAVMYFENLTDPEDKDHTGDMLTNLLTTSLSQLNGIEVISRERLFDLQQEMGKPNEKRLTPALATRIAKRAGVKTMLLGNVLGSQPRLAVTSRLIDVQSGKIISSRRLAGFLGDSLFSFVDSLAILVTNDLKLPPSSVADIKSVAEVTTGSAEAYRAYVKGTELFKTALYSDARVAFEQAIQLDSNFAMAYYQLSFSEIWAPKDKTSRVKNLQKVWELRKGVTEKERLRIEAFYAAQGEGDVSKATEIREKIVQKYPHEQQEYELLWVSYFFFLDEYDKARQSLLRGLKADSLDEVMVIDLSYDYALLGDKKEALGAAERYIRLQPAEPNPYNVKGDIHFYFGEVDSAIYWYQKALTFRPDFASAEKLAFIMLLRQDYANAEGYFDRFASSLRPSEKLKGEAQLTLIPLMQGKFKEVKTRLLKLYASTSTTIMLRNVRGRTNDVYHLLTYLALETGDRAEALGYARAIYEEARANPLNWLRARDLLAIAYLRNGNRDTAYQLLNDLKREAVGRKRVEMRWFPNYTAGFLAYEDGKYRVAVENFEKELKRRRLQGPLFQYAVALLKTGRIDEAIKELKRVTWWVPMGDAGEDFVANLPVRTAWPIFAVKAHYWLGVAYEQKGDKVKAVQEYEKFLDIWKNADPGIAEITDARERLTQLKKKG